MERFDRITIPVDPIYENEREAIRLLALIVSEFETDPMSVQCFDLRVVEQAKQCVRNREAFERRGLLPPLLTEGKR